MGKVYSLLTRPIRTFNIANRVEKVISQKKPIPAPQYASAEKQRKLTDQVNPSFLEDHYQKDARLDQRLKDVFVTSTRVQEEVSREPKSLPQNRRGVDEYVINFYEPVVVPEGKCSVTQVCTFISQHKVDPMIYNSEKIATEYKLDKKVVDNILKHFKLYVSIDTDDSEMIEPDPPQESLDAHLRMQEKKKLEKKEK